MVEIECRIKKLEEKVGDTISWQQKWDARAEEVERAKREAEGRGEQGIGAIQIALAQVFGEKEGRKIYTGFLLEVFARVNEKNARNEEERKRVREMRRRAACVF